MKNNLLRSTKTKPRPISNQACRMTKKIKINKILQTVIFSEMAKILKRLTLLALEILKHNFKGFMLI